MQLLLGQALWALQRDSEKQLRKMPRRGMLATAPVLPIGCLCGDCRVVWVQTPGESHRHGGSGPEATGQSPTAAFLEWLWSSPLFEAREGPQEFHQERALQCGRSYWWAQQWVPEPQFCELLVPSAKPS